MPVDLNLLVESFAPATGEVLLFFAKLEHPDFTDGIVYLVDDQVAHTRNGQVYTAFPFKVQLPDSSDDLGESRFSVDALGAPSSPEPASEPVGGAGVSRPHTFAQSPLEAGSVVVRESPAGAVLAEDDGKGGFLGTGLSSPSGIAYQTGQMHVTFDADPGSIEVDYRYFTHGESVVSLIRKLAVIKGPVIVDLVLATASDPDKTQLQFPRLQWTEVAYDLRVCEGALVGSVALNAGLQGRGRRFTPRATPRLFGVG